MIMYCLSRALFIVFFNFRNDSFRGRVSSFSIKHSFPAKSKRHYQLQYMGKKIQGKTWKSQPETASSFRMPSLAAAKTQGTQDSDYNAPENWAKYALLCSSFSDGVKQSEPAKRFLKKCLVSKLAKDYLWRKERAVKESARVSPCNGPNIDALNDLEKADSLMKTFENGSYLLDGDEDDVNEMLRLIVTEKDKTNASALSSHDPVVRLVYIPTAMYAIRKDSNNTPGKQRQRARADGKKRRDVIVKTIKELMGEGVSVYSVTLDLDEGSIKQPAGTDVASRFPKEGKQALASWRPHIIYLEGGNTFWLHHCMNLGDWDYYIRKACSGRNAPSIYCGTSAGAIVAGAKVETATWKGWDDPSIIPGMEDADDWKGVDGVGLVGKTSFFPHLSDEWEAIANEKKDAMDDSSVVCLRDMDVCCVEGRTQKYSVFKGNSEAELDVERSN